jgi:hypothetical protein
MRYAEMRNLVFARGSVADGYTGKRANVEFALHDRTVILVADCGFYPWAGTLDSFDFTADAFRAIKESGRVEALEPFSRY